MVRHDWLKRTDRDTRRGSLPPLYKNQYNSYDRYDKEVVGEKPPAMAATIPINHQNVFRTTISQATNLHLAEMIDPNGVTRVLESRNSGNRRRRSHLQTSLPIGWSEDCKRARLWSVIRLRRSRQSKRMKNKKGRIRVPVLLNKGKLLKYIRQIVSIQYHYQIFGLIGAITMNYEKQNTCRQPAN